jgi:hypothetical protein
MAAASVCHELKNYVFRRLNDDDRDKQNGKWWTVYEHHPSANWAFFEYGKDTPMPSVTCVEPERNEDWSGFICQPYIP